MGGITVCRLQEIKDWINVQAPNLTNPDYFDDLSRTFNSIVSTNAHVWLAGDFNLPGIDWGVGAPSPAAKNLQQCNRLLATINDSGLSRMILEATRTDINISNTLDLFFTNTPDLINRQQIIPGISDHHVPMLDIDTHIAFNKKVAHKVYLYYNSPYGHCHSPHRTSHLWRLFVVFTDRVLSRSLCERS